MVKLKMNTLQKFHCECGAPLKATSCIVECEYCGNRYLFDGQLQGKPLKKYETAKIFLDYGMVTPNTIREWLGIMSPSKIMAM